ncbi:PaaX family transcriptional regulator C-terminal domain-containing protein [Egibacter rhizosphaerae]|uniref:PaaX family transcriptional regulator n=1 Tax=Egibacter rhizosphaerae TaxID=1670831 RepID=UPI0013F1472C|nr:PaaX family transcriptional regulator C-terminal domain-containing protein [Egibacter rhizosphaerae]
MRARSQRLLVTLLGEYWSEPGTPIPSATLVSLLGEFGIAPANARAALARLARRGLLERSRNGRRTYYDLTPEAVAVLERGAQRIFGLGRRGASWDGRWTVVIFSVPDAERDLRHLVRSRLRWLTFSPLYDAVWVSPHADPDDVLHLLDQLGLTDVLVMRTSDVSFREGSSQRLEQAWDLAALAERYETFLSRFRPLVERAGRDRIDAAEALVGRTEMVDEWRGIARDDPDLPAQFLPEHFPRAEANEVFMQAYEALKAPARERFEELVAGSADESGSASTASA